MRFIRIIYLISAISICTFSVGVNQVYGQVSDTGGGDTGTRPPEDQPFRWGLKAGTTLNQFNHAGLTIGFNGGGFAKYSLGELFDVQAELLYMTQGSSRDDYTRDLSDLGGDVTSERYINRAVVFQNIVIPVMGIYKLGSVEGAIRPKVMAGLSAGYCAAAFERRDVIITLSDGTSGISGSDVENVGSDYQQFQFAGFAGFGVDFNLSNGKIFMYEVRYSTGLNDLNLFKTPDVGGAIYQNTLSINLGYGF
jgi:hypothetical protein